MRRRNSELAFLLMSFILLGIAGWYTAVQHIGRSARISVPPGTGSLGGSPINLLRCSADELRTVLSRRIAEPDLSKVQRAILEWRRTMIAEQRTGVFLAELLRPSSGGGRPALLDAEVYRSLRPFWVVKGPAEALRSWLGYLGLLLLSFLLAHLVFRFTGFQGSEVLLPLSLLLCGTSAMLLLTLRDPLREQPLYAPFAVGAALGCAGLTAAARFVRVQALERHRNAFLTTGIVLSLMLVFIGGGPAGTDAKVNLFGLFQPIQFIKILVVLFLAGYFTGKDQSLRAREACRWRGLSLPRGRDVIPVVPFLAATLSLFFLQRDLGPSLILFLVFLGMFAMTRRRAAVGLVGLILLLAGFWGAYHFRLLQTVATRIEMWLSPWDNHGPGGVQLAESLWALASGGFWGTGPRGSDPRYIPAGHTDLILAAAGEVFGFPGLAAILIVSASLFGLMVYHAWRSPVNYAAHLGLGLALLFGFQTVIVAAGTVGLLPLSGVPIPFMSYGKSALLADFILLGLVLNISSMGFRGRETRSGIPSGALVFPIVTFLALVCVILRTSQIMSFQADEILCKGSLTPQQDGVRRFTYNRRLLDVASLITRGSILDRTGIPLASNRLEELPRAERVLKDLGLETPPLVSGRRFYPLGPFAAQVLGHTRGYWVDPKTVERSEDPRLRGYPAASETVLVDGKRALRQDLSALAPAFRDRFSQAGGELVEMERRDKDVRLTLDAHMQVIALRALERNLPAFAGVPRTKGAAAVVNAFTGEILACVSLPTYDPNTISEADLEKIYGSETKAAYDRARFEIYPPGSTFEIAAAAAALEGGEAGLSRSAGPVVCRHVNDILWQYAGAGGRFRVTDSETQLPHGQLDLWRAFVASCDVYFAWLGTQLGSERLFEYGRNRFQLELKGVNKAQDLVPDLPDNADGAAKVTASPLRLAAMAAVIANGGFRIEPSLISTAAGAPGTKTRVLKETTAVALKEWMEEVVHFTTGRRAASGGWVVGGKTGTARNDTGDGRPHSWFVGFARPSHAKPEDTLAFAFLVENGGHGEGAASQAVHDFLAAIPPTWRNFNRSR